MSGTIVDKSGRPLAALNFKHYAVNTANDPIKSGAGVLKRVVINKKGTGTSAVELYDGADNSGAAIPKIDAAVALGGFEFDASFAAGLAIVITGSTPPDVTVLYA